MNKKILYRKNIIRKNKPHKSIKKLNQHIKKLEKLINSMGEDFKDICSENNYTLTYTGKPTRSVSLSVGISCELFRKLFNTWREDTSMGMNGMYAVLDGIQYHCYTEITVEKTIDDIEDYRRMEEEAVMYAEMVKEKERIRKNRSLYEKKEIWI